MGPWAAQGDEKHFLSSNYHSRKRRPPLCHLDRSAAQWRDLCVDALSWECFSTERSGGTCGSAALPWECFSTGEVMVLRAHPR
jgi:hypothetical protein